MGKIHYFICFIVLLSIEICIGFFIRDDFIRPYVGDMLVVMLMYYFVRMFIPNKLRWLPLYIFSFACFVEVLQYFGGAELFGTSNKIASLVLGATFDVKDIICYAIGTLLIVITEYMLKAKENNHT